MNQIFGRPPRQNISQQVNPIIPQQGANLQGTQAQFSQDTRSQSDISEGQTTAYSECNSISDFQSSFNTPNQRGLIHSSQEEDQAQGGLNIQVYCRGCEHYFIINLGYNSENQQPPYFKIGKIQGKMRCPQCQSMLLQPQIISLILKNCMIKLETQWSDSIQKVRQFRICYNSEKIPLQLSGLLSYLEIRVVPISEQQQHQQLLRSFKFK